MWNGLPQAVEARLVKGNGIHVSPKTASGALAYDDAGMDTEEWNDEKAVEGRNVRGTRAGFSFGNMSVMPFSG